MTEQKALAKQERAIDRVTNYMDSPVIRARFAQIMGERGASTYISSVLVAVADSKALQACEPVSVYTSALRAATLRLSVDPGIGQAYMVPFGQRANLIVGYKGLHDMAVRTGKYRYINVGPVYEGEEVTENRISGFHSLSGHATSKKVIGWLGAFELYAGYAKTLYMTVEEIHEHAKKYSKSYDFKDSPWKTETPKMERKTVLRLMLRRWGYMDPADMQVMDEIEADDNVIEAEFDALAENLDEREPEEKRTADQNLHDLGFEPEKKKAAKNPEPIDDKTWDSWLALCVNAEKLDIGYPNIDRENTTKTDLKAGYNDLAAKVKAANDNTD